MKRVKQMEEKTEFQKPMEHTQAYLFVIEVSEGRRMDQKMFEQMMAKNS